VPPRRYESSVRVAQAAENRRRLIAAATDLFVLHGWAETTMSQVAAEAGLARPTLYLHFDSKLALLLACIDAALSDVPVRERDDYQAMRTGAVPHRAAVAARWLRSAYERSASIQRVLDDAAVTTPDATAAVASMERRRHDEFAHACTLVLGNSVVPMDSLVDEVWALGSRTMWFKLAERGWSPQRWEDWFARVLLDAIRAHGRDRTTHRQH